MSNSTGRVLVVDDDATNRLVLSRALESQGHEVVTADDGMAALRVLRNDAAIDLVLLDVMMPEMDGIDVLRFIKGDAATAQLPVVMISAMDDSERIANCLELGAEDYLPKPFDARILRARVDSAIGKKRWRDVEMSYLSRIEEEEEKSDRLLASLLPRHVLDRLKEGETVADAVPAATVLFADLAGFTAWSATVDPATVVRVLDGIFRSFDAICANYGIEKIKTIGDAYMAAGGLPGGGAVDPAAAIVESARDMLDVVAALDLPIGLRIGVHAGPLVAGVIGSDKPVYDVWGDTVNVASRLESQGEPDRIQISDELRRLLPDDVPCTTRGVIDLRNRGETQTWWVDRRSDVLRP